MPFDPRQYMKLMFYTIIIILVCTYVFSNEKLIDVLDKIEQVEKDGDKVYWNKITTIEPKNAADQYCYVKVIIKQSDDKIIKEDIMECADGKKGIETPGYWELFAQFYYIDIHTPEYCRYYNREGHAFKTPGKVCLQKNGEWEVR